MFLDHILVAGMDFYATFMFFLEFERVALTFIMWTKTSKVFFKISSKIMFGTT